MECKELEMTKVVSIENRTSDEWLNRIADLEPKVLEAEHRVDDIQGGCNRLQLVASEGSEQAAKDLEQQKATLEAAITDRDALRASLVAAREIVDEVREREADALDTVTRDRIVALANERAKQAAAVQKHINALTKGLAKMLDTGIEIDRLAKQQDVRNHYCGDGFASRICQALGPALKRFGVLAHGDSSHPKFGQPLTVSEGCGEDALAMLDRGINEAVRQQERIDASLNRRKAL
jgi:hypothetical protein